MQRSPLVIAEQLVDLLPDLPRELLLSARFQQVPICRHSGRDRVKFMRCHLAPCSLDGAISYQVCRVGFVVDPAAWHFDTPPPGIARSDMALSGQCKRPLCRSL